VLAVWLQNVSGLNRQAKQEDIMSDPKNRLVKSYLEMLKQLQPPYLLIEQVCPG
jgi:site-specific DNA-cytosine methylase